MVDNIHWWCTGYNKFSWFKKNAYISDDAVDITNLLEGTRYIYRGNLTDKRSSCVNVHDPTIGLLQLIP